MAGREFLAGENPVSNSRFLGAQALPPAVAKFGQRFQRQINVGGTHYGTDLPHEVYPFESPMNYVSGDRLVYTQLQPAALDDMPVGRFTIFETPDTEGFDADTANDIGRRELRILEGPQGKVVSISSFGASDENDMPRIASDADEAYFTLIGAVVSDEAGVKTLAAVPTPDTFVASASIAGVTVKTFPELETILPEVYLTHVKDKRFALPIDGQWAYLHGIADPVLRMLLLGNEAVANVIQEAASGMLTVAENNPRQLAELRCNLEDYCDSLYAAMGDADAASRQRQLTAAQTKGFSIGIAINQTTDLVATSS